MLKSHALERLSKEGMYVLMEMMKRYYLITGGSSGIGVACAKQLVAEGMNVVLVSSNESKLKKAAEEIGECAEYIACELSDLQNVPAIFRETQRRGIVFDGMIHSAGIANPTPIACEEAENIQRMMNVNCLSFMVLGKEFYKRVNSKKGASIVAISSLAAQYPSKGQGVYATSKAALNTMVAVMAKEFLRRKIRVNAVMPSYVDTPMIHDTTKAFMDNGAENLPLGIIEPSQVANLVSYLLSEKARNITGTSIPVSSGL